MNYGYSAEQFSYFYHFLWQRTNRNYFYVQYVATLDVDMASVLGRVAEPKLFDSAPAPAPTFKKFPLRLRLELCGCLFSQLLNEKVDFS
jgi:hypothetical protein